MTETPEWFQLTADDQKPEAPKSKKRTFKLAILAAPLILVGGAMVFAEGGAEADDAPAIDNSIPAATASVNSPSGTTSTTTSSSASVGVANPTTTSKAGVGVPAPGAQGDDDHDGFRPEREDDDDHDGFRPEGGEHHERGEHKERASAPKIPTSGTTTTKN